MGEKFSLKVDDGLLKQLVTQELNISVFLSRLFGRMNGSDYRAMCEGLVAYHNKEGGSPEVKEFEVTESGFSAESKTGFCKCKFNIHFHYTCSDVHNDATDIIRWDFKLDEGSSTIHFIGEEPWVRDAE